MCGSFSCLVSTAAVGQQFIDREGGVFYVRMVELFKKVTGVAHVHVSHHQLCDETSLVSPDDYLASDLFMPGARLMQYGLSDHNAAKHRWYYFPKMQMDDVLLFKQFESDTALPGRMTFHTAFVDPTVRPDVLERQSIECSVQHLSSFAFQCSGKGDCFSRRALLVGPLEGPRVVRVDAKRRVVRSTRRTHVSELGYEVR